MYEIVPPCRTYAITTPSSQSRCICLSPLTSSAPMGSLHRQLNRGDWLVRKFPEKHVYALVRAPANTQVTQ
ncbi:hypothetical protein ECG_02518 [Echinococcus granulosus]|nr:hypothetical protein ECG_02518 [Echinococcus granulosus]